jgi:hypothetical protein
MTRAISSPMTEAVIDDATPVIDDAETRRDSYATPRRDCARGAGWVEPRRIAVSLAMSSLMAESVIGHAVPVSDHDNPLIDH